MKVISVRITDSFADSAPADRCTLQESESALDWIGRNLPQELPRLETDLPRLYAQGARTIAREAARRALLSQGYVTYQQDKYLEPIVPLIGEDNIIWGADYPHPDCVWPESRRHIEANLGMLSERVRRKITRDNVVKLYHLA